MQDREKGIVGHASVEHNASDGGTPQRHSKDSGVVRNGLVDDADRALNFKQMMTHVVELVLTQKYLQSKLSVEAALREESQS